MDHPLSSSRFKNPQTNQEAIEYCRNEEISPNGLLIRGAKTGSIEEMRIAKLAEACKFEKAFKKAVETGHLNCTILLNKWKEDLSLVWNPLIFNFAMNIAATHNQIEIMIWLLTKEEAIDYSRAFGFAAQNGNINSMEFIKDCHENINYLFSIQTSISRNQTKSLEMLKEWGVLDYDSLLIQIINHSCQNNQNGEKLELIYLVKEWGATNFSQAKEYSIRHKQYDLAKLLAKWEEEASAES